MHSIAADMEVRADPEVVACELGSGAALLNLRSSIYYNLNEVGAFIWQRLEQTTSIENLCEDVRGSFDVGPEQCRKDVLALLSEMQRLGLIEVASPAHA